MENKEFQSYAKKRFKKINGILKKESHSTTENSIHDLRTELKKIRTIMGMDKRKNALQKEQKVIDKVFDEAGEIRTFQLVLKTLDRPEINRSLVKDNKKKLDKLTKEFKKSASHNRRTIKEAGDKVMKFAAKSGTADIKKYLGTVKQKINKLSALKRDSGQWHELRKSLKIYLYLQNGLPRIPSTVKQRNTIHSMKRFERILGNWHNDSVHLQEIEKLNLQNPHASFDNVIQKLISGKKRKETNIKIHLKKRRSAL